MSPSRRRDAIGRVRQVLPVSERRACCVLGQHRSTQRHPPTCDAEEQRLTADIVALATDYGRYGYRRIHALVQRAGWRVSRSVVERIWRREGLKVPQRQLKRRRLWLGDGSCIRLRPIRENHVWSYDFVEDRTQDGRKFRMLNVIDEFSWNWLGRLGVMTLFIEPGSPWENDYIESFNARLRDELLNGEIFCSLEEVRCVTAWWREHYNTTRPHSSLGYRPPAPETIAFPAWPLGAATRHLTPMLETERRIG